MLELNSTRDTIGQEEVFHNTDLDYASLQPFQEKVINFTYKTFSHIYVSTSQNKTSNINSYSTSEINYHFYTHDRCLA